MRSPCDYVIAWTPDGVERSIERIRLTGGTGQAIDLADRFRIPVFNLKKPNAMVRIKEWITSNPN